MLSFRTRGGASLAYRADFSEFSYANISFFDRGRNEIPFHLSLRVQEGLAVCNRRAGGQWDKEDPIAVTLGDEASVEIRFEDDGVRVVLNGEEILHREEGYPAVETIEMMNFTGGLDETSLELGGAANSERVGHGALHLHSPFVLEGWAYDPGLAQQVIDLDVAGLREPPGVSVFARPNIAREQGAPTEMIGAHATLPGRVWQADGAEAGLSITLRSNGIPCGPPLHLTREDVLHHVEELIAAHPPEEAGNTDPAAMLLAIEHVRFAELMPRLSSRAADSIRAAARRYGVETFLHPQADDEAEADPAASVSALPSRAPEKVLLDRVRATFVETVRADPDLDPAEVLAELLEENFMPPAIRRKLLLLLTEYFCMQDAFAALYAVAETSGDLAFAPGEEMTFNVQILPYLYRQRRGEEIKDVLWRLAKPTRGWISTAIIGWLMRQVAARDDRHLGSREAEEVLYAAFAFMERLCGDYWESSRCEALIDGMVQLLVNAGGFSDPMRRAIAGKALKFYGLSAQFWRRVDGEVSAGRLVLPGDLAQGRRAFAALEAFMEGGSDPVEPALRVFGSFETFGTEQARREILGPAGISLAGLEADGGEAALSSLYGAGRDVTEAALRSLAFPGVSAPALAGAAAEAVTRRLSEQEHVEFHTAPFHGLQKETSERCLRLLSDLAAGQALRDAEITDHLLPAFSSMAGQRSQFIGLGLGLSLVTGLLGAGEEKAAGRVLTHLGSVVSRLPETEIGQLRHASALQAALFGLARRFDPAESRVAEAALALFPNITAQLPRAPEPPVEVPLAWAAANPLFDCIVAVFSCKPYLDSRVGALRESWLGMLDDLGVPYVIVVGDGDDSLDGDVLRVSAPDSYEGLPQKTLKTVEWILANTGFSHMLKIDDDCFLNAGEFFHSQSWRKFDYFGRRIYRRVGDMDRTWHTGKSSSDRGRFELDKSPEPAAYADGGSGYVLSRRAMSTLVNIQKSPESRRLIQNSFMEDKMVGDLLNLGGIEVREEDYYMSILRRTHAGALPVSLWVNGFHPSKAAPVKLVHLDAAEPQKAVLEGMSGSELRPRKIWPSFQATKLGFDSNALELVSPEEKLFAVNAAPVAVVACVRNEMFMIRHFLAHYRKLGVKAFLIADNCSDDGTLEFLAGEPDVAVFSVDTQYSRSAYGVAWQQALIANFRVGRWSILADADEMLLFPGWEAGGLPALLSGPAYAGVDAVRCFMLDMYPQGPLSEVDFTSGDLFAEAGCVEREPFLTNWMGQGTYSNSPTWTSALRHRLIEGSRPEIFVGQKFALLKYKPWMRMSAGLHYAADVRPAAQDMLLAHFKYHAEFRRKAHAEVARRQHFNDAEEYRKYLAVLAEGRGVIFDPDHSVPWQECAFVQRVLGGAAG